MHSSQRNTARRNDGVQWLEGAVACNGKRGNVNGRAHMPTAARLTIASRHWATRLHGYTAIAFSIVQAGSSDSAT